MSTTTLPKRPFPGSNDKTFASDAVAVVASTAEVSMKNKTHNHNSHNQKSSSPTIIRRDDDCCYGHRQPHPYCNNLNENGIPTFIREDSLRSFSTPTKNTVSVMPKFKNSSNVNNELLASSPTTHSAIKLDEIMENSKTLDSFSSSTTSSQSPTITAMPHATATTSIEKANNNDTPNCCGWVWKVTMSQLPIVPNYIPLERTSLRLRIVSSSSSESTATNTNTNINLDNNKTQHTTTNPHPLSYLECSSLDDITSQISHFMRINSISCCYHPSATTCYTTTTTTTTHNNDHHYGRIDCWTDNCLKFVVQLWRVHHDSNNDDDDDGNKNSNDRNKNNKTQKSSGVVVVVEVQRRRGCAIAMKFLRQSLYKAIILSSTTNKKIMMNDNNHHHHHHHRSHGIESSAPASLPLSCGYSAPPNHRHPHPHPHPHHPNGKLISPTLEQQICQDLLLRKRRNAAAVTSPLANGSNKEAEQGGYYTKHNDNSHNISNIYKKIKTRNMTIIPRNPQPLLQNQQPYDDSIKHSSTIITNENNDYNHKEHDYNDTHDYNHHPKQDDSLDLCLERLFCLDLLESKRKDENRLGIESLLALTTTTTTAAAASISTVEHDEDTSSYPSTSTATTTSSASLLLSLQKRKRDCIDIITRSLVYNEGPIACRLRRAFVAILTNARDDTGADIDHADIDDADDCGNDEQAKVPHSRRRSSSTNIWSRNATQGSPVIVHSNNNKTTSNSSSDDEDDEDDDHQDDDDVSLLESSPSSSFYYQEVEDTHLLALKVLANCLEVIARNEQDYLSNEANRLLNLWSPFWRCILKVCVGNLKESSFRPQEAALSAKCLRLLEGLEPEIMTPFINHVVAPWLQQAHAFGKAHHLSLEKESESLLQIMVVENATTGLAATKTNVPTLSNGIFL